MSHFKLKELRKASCGSDYLQHCLMLLVSLTPLALEAWVDLLSDPLMPQHRLTSLILKYVAVLSSTDSLWTCLLKSCRVWRVFSVVFHDQPPTPGLGLFQSSKVRREEEDVAGGSDWFLLLKMKQLWMSNDQKESSNTSNRSSSRTLSCPIKQTWDVHLQADVKTKSTLT